MAKVNYLLLSEGASIDVSTKQVSLFNLFDRIDAPSLPAATGKFSVSTSITPDKGDSEEDKIKFILKVIDPSGEVLLSANGEGEAKFSKELDSYLSIVVTTDISDKLIFKKEGPHLVTLSMGELQVAETRFRVRLKKKEE